jgi:PhnB protein
MKVQPYLFFDGRCEEAIEFYRQALGAEVLALMRFRDSPDPPPPGMLAPGSEDKVMHASLRIGETEIMASDGRCAGKPAFQGVSLSLSVPGEAEADRLFDALAEGGQVQMPLGPTFFSPSFGTVADRFGVPWMIVADA